MSAIHSVVVAPSDPSVVWVGTGDPSAFDHALAPGDGVYKSEDGGHSWTNVGLRDTRYVGRIVAHPTDSKTAWVGAVGPLATASHARGVFRTTDGGRVWNQTLFINEWTGAIDLVIDPHDPNTLYAAMLQQGGSSAAWVARGPTSGIYKSTDAGITWRQVTHGLPVGDLGRIGLSVSPASSNVIYAVADLPELTSGVAQACVAHVGVYRSDDRGENWHKGAVLRLCTGYYFGRIVADPKDVDRAYVFTGHLQLTTDGGTTFRQLPREPGQGDTHALWIDPAHVDHMVLGDDVGLWISHDRAATWRHVVNLSLGQFRTVAVDRRWPFYFVYGESQDHEGTSGPSQTAKPYGVSNADWTGTLSDEFGPVVPEPDDPNFLYALGGAGLGVARSNMAARQRQEMVPEADAWQLAFNRNHQTPIVFSPHERRTVYTGTTRLMRSTDRGEHWEPASGVLTRPATDSVTLMGRAFRYALESQIGAAYHTLSTIAESPVAAGVLYVGTQDGLLHVTRDGGRNWTTQDGFSGAPRGVAVSRVGVSQVDAGTAYATVNAALAGDYRPYVYRTTDFGAHWTMITTGLPNSAAAWVVTEHVRSRGLLFLGTDVGVFMSLDAGTHWQSLRENMPAVQVRDLVVQPDANDLVAASYGRGLWVIDDITPLERLAAAAVSPAPTIFPIRDAFQLNATALDTAYAPEATPNPPAAIISYYIPTGHPSRWTVEVFDPTGTRVRTFAVDSTAGIHRIGWDLTTQAASDSSAEPWRAIPGTYHVRLATHGTAARDVVAEAPLVIRPAPGLQVTAAILDSIRAARRLAVELRDKLQVVFARASRLALSLDTVRAELARKAPADRSMIRQAVALRREIDRALALKEWFRIGDTEYPRNIAYLVVVWEREVGALTVTPPSASLADIARMADHELKAETGRLDTIRSNDLPQLLSAVRRVTGSGQR